MESEALCVCSVAVMGWDGGRVFSKSGATRHGRPKVVVHASSAQQHSCDCCGSPEGEKAKGNKTRGATFGSLLLWPSWLVDTL